MQGCYKLHVLNLMVHVLQASSVLQTGWHCVQSSPALKGGVTATIAFQARYVAQMLDMRHDTQDSNDWPLLFIPIIPPMSSTIHLSLEIPVKYRAEICVIGAGPSGVAAAVSAARLGKKVILLDANTFPGGLSTAARVPVLMPYSDGHRILMKGFGEDFLQRLGTRGPLEAEHVKRVFDAMLGEAGVDVLYGCHFFAADCENGKIRSACFQSISGNFAVEAGLFIDASGDGALAVAVGCEYVVGGEAGETMPPTLCSLWTGFDWGAYLAGGAFSHNDENMLEKLSAAFASGELSTPDWHHTGMTRLTPQLAGANIGHVFDVDVMDEQSVSQALVTARQQLVEYEAFYQKHIAGFEHACIAASGSMLGIRETRRILGEYVLCREDYLARRSFVDEIGRYNFPADIHPAHPTREMLEEHKRCFRGEGYKAGESYGIPYRSLIPRHTVNLLICGRCISCDRYVFASVRVIPGCFISGQAAGFAAALCVEKKCSPKELDSAQLRATMAEHQALLE